MLFSFSSVVTCYWGFFASWFPVVNSNIAPITVQRDYLYRRGNRQGEHEQSVLFFFSSWSLLTVNLVFLVLTSVVVWIFETGRPSTILTGLGYDRMWLFRLKPNTIISNTNWISNKENFEYFGYFFFFFCEFSYLVNNNT